MKQILVLLILTLTIISCGTIQEEIQLYPNHQAELTFSMELGKNMVDPFSEVMSSLLFNTKRKSLIKPKFSGNFSILGAPLNNQDIEVDTILYLKDISDFRDSLRLTIEEWNTTHRLTPEQQEKFFHKCSDLLSHSYIRVRNNTPDCFVRLSFVTGKTSLQDLYTIGNDLKRLLSDSTEALCQAEDFLFYTKKGTFERGKFALWQDLLGNMNMGSKEELNFLEKLIQGLKPLEYRSIIHLPCEVKSVSNPLSKITKDKQTVTTILSIEEIEQGYTFENTIKYKNK